MWGNEPSHSQVSSHFRSWSHDGLSNLQRTIAGIKTNWIEEFLISLKSSWNVDVWNGLAWPIWILKTQVTVKRKVGSQICNLTLDHLKSRITSISLRAGGIQQKIQFFFRPHLNPRSAHKIMGPPKSRESQLWEFRHIWVLVPWPSKEYIIRGKVVASPKSGPWWILWVCVCPWLVRAPKCSNYALTNLLFGFCKSVWVSELLVNFLSAILELQHTPLPPKCYKLKSRPQLLFVPLFSPLDSQLSPSRNLKVCHYTYTHNLCMYPIHIHKPNINFFLKIS